MHKKKGFPIITTIALLLLFISFMIMPQTGYTENSPYTITVKYYDSVQITYTLKYPSGGIWSGAGDIPIGGISDKVKPISDQVYCADPFVNFHRLADTSNWVNGILTDEKSGYVTAAPWAVTGAIRHNMEAVSWIVANGYRGNYLVPNDPVSAASVKNLQDLYPKLGSKIDKTIALMATKVAVWKAIAGESVSILKTSLDHDANKRATFEELVSLMVAHATNELPRPAEAKTTSFRIEIDKSQIPIELSYDNEAVYYGPLTMKAELMDIISSSSSTPAVDKVFLTVNGMDLDGIKFVEEYMEENDTITSSALLSGIVYGTDKTAQYLSGGSFTPPSEIDGCFWWESSEFYLKIPKNRSTTSGFPEDFLAINAMAMADDVPLEEGTPILFIHENDGIQDWNSVQAFIGAARIDLVTNLYAETKLNTGKHTLGEIWIIKHVTGGSALDNDAEFKFRLYHSETTDPDDWTQVKLISHADSESDYDSDPDFKAGPGTGFVSGASQVEDNWFTLKNGGIAIIDRLPADANEKNIYYWIEEEYFSDSDYETPLYQILIADGSSMNNPISNADNLAGPFVMNTDNGYGIAAVQFINTKTIPKAFLDISKGTLKYFPDGSEPELINDLEFNFMIEFSSDEGKSWAPLNISNIFLSGARNLTNASAGEFLLKTVGDVRTRDLSDLAVFELDARYLYRVTELNTDPKYLATYAKYHYHFDESETSLQWRTFSLTYGDEDENWVADESGSYTMSGFSVEEGDYYAIMFVNIEAIICDLSISKTVTGQASAGDMEKLFPFTVYFMDDYAGASAPLPIAISMEATPHTSIIEIEGVQNDSRIGLDSNNSPTIFYLKSGETATIKNLPAGNYKICEWASANYTTTYSVGQGEKRSLPNSGETDVFNISGNTTVAFTNHVPSIPDIPFSPVTPGDPGTPDKPVGPEKPETPTPPVPALPQDPKPDTPEETDPNINYASGDPTAAPDVAPDTTTLDGASPRGTGSPQTGDETGAADALTLFLIGIICICSAALRLKYLSKKLNNWQFGTVDKSADPNSG